MDGIVRIVNLVVSLHLDLFSMPYGVKNYLRLAYSQMNVGLRPLDQVRKSLMFSVLLI